MDKGYKNHFDVVIIGAGISGISAAYHLQTECPNRTYAILEGRDNIGGTWDLFKYPGIRSDSDMYTLGFSFRPWTDPKAIADGPSIMKYLNEAVADYELEPHIHFGTKVVSANWSSEQSCWQIETQVNGVKKTYTANFIFGCTGYYNYESGYTPDFKGMDAFKGQIIHPQQWPEDLDYSNKKMVVIGSGATAMTLVPAMSELAAKVTMLQRSPTYVVSRSDQDAVANFLRKILPEKWAYALTRWKNVEMQRFFFNRTRTKPQKVKAKLLEMVRQELGDDYDIEKHFTPTYNPWDQRLCLVPNADLFKAIKSKKAEVVTEHIDTFVPEGVRLKSGETIEADIIVTATGLNLEVLGGASFSVDGKPLNFAETFSYKGMMYSDVPNLIQTFGYINASWTLRADLTSEYAVRVLNHLTDSNTTQVTPRVTPADADMPARPWIVDFPAGYMERSMHLFPKQGDRHPWLNTQNFALDRKTIRNAPLTDGSLIFSGPTRKGAVEAQGHAAVQSDVA